ncbi:TonB family protein [uncultured Parasutterella sp.]|jgi:TonB family C-terminal domain|uniref:TonB family protein n=1 Tax=uncultured Parasutterella sp. TaxID=1263098 RepID=UPI0025922802|nr:TonB family protein [uncultured Parasutterella sp.]
MRSVPREDKNVRKAKRIAKVLVLLALGFIFWLIRGHKDETVVPVQPMQLIELSFEQFVPPQSAPEPQPEEKRLLAEDSDLKTAPEPEPKPEPKPEPVRKPEPISEPVKPPEPVKPKKAVKKEISKTVKKAVSQEPPTQSASAAKTQGNEKANELKTRNTIASMLVALVEKRKRYPKAARRAAMEGVTEVLFTVDKTGKITAASVSQASGKGPLDRECESLAARLVGTELGVSNPGLKLTVPIRFTLSDS